MLAISLWLSTTLLLSFKVIETLDFILSKKDDYGFMVYGYG